MSSNPNPGICEKFKFSFLFYSFVQGKKINENKNPPMVFNDTFNNISVISWRSVFIGGGNRSIPEKTTDQMQVRKYTRLYTKISAKLLKTYYDLCITLYEKLCVFNI
jgi:hypothetical protein